MNSEITAALFVFPQQAVVDQNAGQLWPDRLVQQRRDDGRIDAAGEAANHAIGSRLARGPSGPFRSAKSPSCHVPLAAADGHEEVAQYHAAERRVGHFRMKLQAIDRQRSMFHGSDGAGRRFLPERTKSSDTPVT